MKKKSPALRIPRPKAVAQPDDRSWHNGGDIEICLYARSLRKAAKRLIASLDPKPNPKTAWDACPILMLYRDAVELHLKALVGEGSNFLPSPTDPLTLYKTHSLRWLAQIVCQIIKAVRWENEFKCEGVVASLADFSDLVSDLEELDPVSVLVRPGNRRPDFRVPDHLSPSNVVRLARKLDALLDLFGATADALAATWDQMSGEDESQAGNDFKPTIQ